MYRGGLVRGKGNVEPPGGIGGGGGKSHFISFAVFSYVIMILKNSSPTHHLTFHMDEYFKYTSSSLKCRSIEMLELERPKVQPHKNFSHPPPLHNLTTLKPSGLDEAFFSFRRIQFGKEMKRNIKVEGDFFWGLD